MALRIGELLQNRYLVQLVIIRAGESVMYRAEDQNAHRPVVIKEWFSKSPENRQQLLQEAEYFAGLRHPNLMRIIDWFEIPGQGVYQVTDFVDGRKVFDASQSLEGLQVREAVPVILAICDALYYLHHNQPPIIHGEISLDTINFAPDGQVVLIHPKWLITGAPSNADLTKGEIEPASDPRKDIFDLGMVLLEMLSNHPVMGSATDISPELLQDIIGKSAVPIPDGIKMVLTKAVNPKQSEQFLNIEEFKAALLNAVIFMPPASEPYRVSRTVEAISSPAGKFRDEDTTQPVESPPPSVSAPLTKTPIRRRVPWGLLILGL